MPLFKYECRDCGDVSEILVRNSEEPVCGSCGSPKVTKQASAFAAVNAGGGEAAPPDCGGACATGSCPFAG